MLAAGARELRGFGSQGEQRLAVLALLLAEAELIADRRGVPPLLLLDDVLSELDPGRRRILAARVALVGQALVTATDAAMLPVGARPAARGLPRRCPGGGRLMEPLGDEIRSELRRFGPEAAISDAVEAWPAAVGPEIARNAWPARFQRDGTLVVHTRDAVWGFELTHRAAEIAGRLPGSPALKFVPGPLPEPASDAGFRA